MRRCLPIVAGLLACQTPTQITVQLRGVGLECEGGKLPTLKETGVAAKARLVEVTELAATGTLCKVSGDAGAPSTNTDLGDIVLVPSDGSAVELLAVASIDVEGAAATGAEDCAARYLAKDCEADACETCIFARRSLGFIDNTKLQVRIEFEPRCAGVLCDPAQTCVDGACVSSETPCIGETCDLPGGGGAGGTGGAGGSGGGTAGGSVDWGSPIVEAEAGEVLHDIVGNGLTAFELHVAADRRVIRWTSGGAERLPANAAPAGSFMAIALEAFFVNQVWVVGQAGLATQDFEMITLPPNFPPGVAEVFDVTGDGCNGPCFLKSTENAGDTNADSNPEIPDRGALFGLQGGPVGVYNTPASPSIFYSTSSGTTAVSIPNQALEPAIDAPWVLWAYADGMDAYAVAVGGNTANVGAAKWSGEPGSLMGIATAEEVPMASGLRVSAIWGLATNGTAQVFLAGDAAATGWWVGTTRFDPSATTKFSPLLTVNAPENAKLTSIWVGDDHTGEPRVYLATSSAVYAAPVSAFPVP